MPNVQPNYNAALTNAVAGQLASFEPHRVISREVETSGGIAFGAVAVRGTGDHQCKAGSGGTLYLGIVLVDPTVAAGNNNQYVQKDTAAILTKGVVWVVTAVNCTPGQPAYFDSSGLITNVSTSNTAIPNAVFDSTGTAAGLVKLRLN